MLRQDQGGFKEELLLSWKSVIRGNIELSEKAGGGDANEGAEEEVPDGLLTGWHNICHPLHFVLACTRLEIGSNILPVVKSRSGCYGAIMLITF